MWRVPIASPAREEEYRKIKRPFPPPAARCKVI
jgi:hypothetical protein